jgi:hypothetical protein
VSFGLPAEISNPIDQCAIGRRVDSDHRADAHAL